MIWPKRPPDFIIGSKDAPYLLRWHVIPRNRFFNIYLHKFLRSDDDRALHDHPWPSCSILLSGYYIEHTLQGAFPRDPWKLYFRKAEQAHRVQLYGDWNYFAEYKVKREFPVWTLFITGKKVREWGFHCPKGWRHWRDFCSVREGEARGNEIGRGCE